MALTSTDVLNRAINLIGSDQPPVTGAYPNFDSSVAGRAGNALYQGAVQTAARQFGYDFSRTIAALVATGNPAPTGWAYEYSYPTNGIQVRQLIPQALPDPNDPGPINWAVGNRTVGGAPTKVIWTDEPNAQVEFTNMPPEGLWDALFAETVVRLLASELAMAIAGKPDTSQTDLDGFGAFGNAAMGRDS